MIAMHLLRLQFREMLLFVLFLSVSLSSQDSRCRDTVSISWHRDNGFQGSAFNESQGEVE